MSPNKENALSRLLLAIIRQKNLKDIDWDQVAADPILLEPIPNGHAARMRFSRYRNSVTGHESTKRRPSGDQNKVVKVKRESGARKDGLIKVESAVSLQSLDQFSTKSSVSPYLGEGFHDFKSRFPTPCSDDMNLASIPAFADAANHLSKDFAYTTDFMHVAANDPNSLEQSPTATFDDAIDFGNNFPNLPASQNSVMYPPPGGSQSQEDFTNAWGHPLHQGPLF